MSIRVNLIPLEETTAFLKLRRTITYNNSDWALFYIKFRKYKRRWVLVAKVMGKAGALIKARVIIYKVIIQAVLLCGRKIWMVTDVIMTVLKVFHHRIARPIVRMMYRRGDDRGKEWALVDTAMEVTGIWTIR